MKNWQLIECPSGSYTYSYMRPPGLPNPMVCSYGRASWIIGNSGGPSGPPASPLSLASFEDPAGTIDIVDSTAPELWNSATHPDYGTASCVAKRHNEAFNVAFLDGHVKALTASQPGMWTRAAGD
ncbi:MAG: H-X9-DG-CTERM domain-containing protein [Armatimonadota bacterium]